ncbi:MAG TPA: hypothetical protein VGE74_24315 [Gemmata sp.]
MTESDWFSCTDPTAMLGFLRDRGASDRKLRLFAVACCRRIWSLLPPVCRVAVENSEGYADGLESAESRDAVARAAEALALDLNRGGRWGDFAIYATAATVDATSAHAGTIPPAISAASTVAHAVARAAAGESPPDKYDTELDAVEARERVAQSHLLRDIVGNPFRAPSFEPEWRTDTVMALAAQMYASRSFDAMPILGDALADAGCPDGEILEHCRRPGPHVRGCFVVDLVLNKT